MAQDLSKKTVPESPNSLITNSTGVNPDLESNVGLNGTAESLQKVSVGGRAIDQYASVIGEQKIEELKALASRLKGARVLHINSTAYGGGVAEILRSYIPLLRSLGVDARWEVIRGHDEFYNITKSFHNALQGAEYSLDEQTKETYLATNSRNAKCLTGDFDYVVVHDPQPAALRVLHGADNAKWVWRSHIDTSNPNPEVWEFLQPFVEVYDALVFTMDQYVSPGLDKEKVSIVAPAIDPLNPKNMPLSKEFCRKIVGWLGVSLDRPLITQVSRFDPWKDPLGVIRVFQSIRRYVPGLQLAMLGHLALDDPEGQGMYEQVSAAASEDPDIYLFTNYTAASSIEVNAFQRHSDVVIQKSKREGFGLVISEALWKGTPVVAGRAGGIPLQLEDGKAGFLVDSDEECAERVLQLLRDPAQAKKMGLNGRRNIRSNFLTTRLISDELKLLSSL